MDNSTERALNDANRALVNIIGELKYIGWLSRRLGNSNGGGNNGSGGGGTGSGPGSASSSGGGIIGTTSSAGNGCDQVRITVICNHIRCVTVMCIKSVKSAVNKYNINFFPFRRAVDRVQRVLRKMTNGNPDS